MMKEVAERLTGPRIGMYCYKIEPYDTKTFVKVNFIIKIISYNQLFVLGNSIYIKKIYSIHEFNE